MSDITELPQMVTELVNMSKEYLRQETLDPAKNIGRSLRFAVAAAACFGIGILLLTAGITRWVADLVPEGVFWSTLPYAVGIVVMVLALAIAAKKAQR